jgi:hypothetical protein
LAIKKFSSKKPLDKSDLKEFRYYVAQLKQKKLTSRAARSARPYFISDGKTLAELVNKNASKLKPYSPPVPKQSKLPLRRPISVRDFPVKHNSLAGVLRDLDENSAAINKLKNSDEKFAFEIDGIRSYAIFYDIKDLSEYLSESAGIQQVLQKRTKSQELFKALKIVRWNKTATEWKPGPQKARRKSSHAGRQAKTRKRKK